MSITSLSEFTIEEGASSFLRSKRKRLAEKSYPQYEMVVMKLVVDLGASSPVSVLEPPRGTEVIEDFMDKHWADMPYAYNRNLSVVRGLMKHLIERGRLSRDPAAPIEKAKPVKKLRVVFTEDEIRSILGAATSAEERVALRLLLIYGLRKGALTGLTMSGFDESRRIVEFKTKGGKFHTIPIVTDEVWADVAEIRERLEPTDYLLHAKTKPSSPLTPYRCHTWWYEKLAAAGVVEPGVTKGRKMHLARHTSGQRVLNATGNLKAAQELLGHASIATTGNVYALALDTPILTPEGWKTMSTIERGDRVFAADGSPTTVTHVSEVFTDRPCFELQFADSSTIVASADHKWLAYGRHKAEIMSTQDMHNSNYTYRVRSSAVLQLPERALPIDPYVLGYWLGDGGSKTLSVAVGSKDVDYTAAALARYGYSVTRKQVHGGWVVNVSDGNPSHFNASPRSTLPAKLREMGIWETGNKRIPDQYLLSSVSQRRALLAGLLDSDGCLVDKNDKLRVTFISVYDQLADDVHTLVRGLGVRATKRLYEVREGGYGKKATWNICWSPTWNPFQMPRKAEIFDRAVKNGTWSTELVVGKGRRRDLMVVHTSPCESVPTRCLAVEHPEHLYLAGRTLIPTHNTSWSVEEMRSTLEGVDI